MGHIKQLLINMTISERNMIITSPFEDIWNYLWFQNENCSNNTSENMEEYLLTQNFIKINHPNTEDPTFINRKFIELKDKIYIYQGPQK
jgi:hypothetical protein